MNGKPSKAPSDSASKRAHLHRHTYVYAHAYCHSDSNPHSDTIAHTDGDTIANLHPYTEPDADATAVDADAAFTG
jgi:hypothetical protein